MTKKGMQSFAAGLFVATGILAYFHYGDDQTETGETATVEERKAEITEDDVRAFADQNNMVVITKKDYQQLTDGKKQNDNETNKEKPAQTMYQLQLEIAPGTSSQEVADRLLAAKVIDNKEAFMDYLKAQKLETSVKSGTYQLNSNMSIEEIVSIITR